MQKQAVEASGKRYSRIPWRVLAAALVCVGMFGTSTTDAQRRTDPSYVGGELLVRFRPEVSEERRTARAAALSARILQRLGRVGVDHIRLPDGVDPEAAAAALRGDREILAVQPNYVRSVIASAPPDDSYWLSDDPGLWGLRKIDSPAAWFTYTWGDETVVIANLDTGVNYNHPDLAANMWHNPGEIAGNRVDDDRNGYVDDIVGIDTAYGDSDPMDDHGHGTHTAGTTAAVGNNGVGVVGVSWNTKLIACKFLGSDGSGSDAGAIACFNYLIDLKERGVNIRATNNSWGFARGGGYPYALESVIEEAGRAGILNVFAAGNSGSNNDVTPFDPASLRPDSIVAVAASDSNDNRPGFSNYGATSVDLAAPGYKILSTHGSSYGVLSGTSMATPHVVGAAALLFSRYPNLSVAEGKALLMAGADDVGPWPTLVASGGRLNVFGALSQGGSNAPPVISITEPGSGATATAPASFNVTAAASDADGTVQQVTFYANGLPIGTDTEAPFSIEWTGIAAGNYALSAMAKDNLGATSISDPVNVTVNGAAGDGDAPPTVTLTSPADGAQFQAPANMTVTADASDADGIAEVSFYANGTLIGQDTASPFEVTWSEVAAGNYALTAVAVDTRGASTISSAVNVAVKVRGGKGKSPKR